MTLQERIEAFSRLGDKITHITDEELQEHSSRARQENAWFTPENVRHSLEGLAYLLQKEKLHQWLRPYGNLEPEVPRIVGIIMAGNIPLVGFHDLLCVLLAGHFAAIKTSSQDTYLVGMIIGWLVEAEPRFRKNLELRERLTDIDALIATGSDNTARHFEYYFRNHPKIIRKNRTSVAILDGSESPEDLKNLGKDIFWYFGLGCRNISKLFVPNQYDPKPFFEAIEEFAYIGDHHKYKNNYDYHKSILLVNRVDHLDNGFLLWNVNENLVSPLSVLYVETYDSPEEVTDRLSEHKDKLQCIVSKKHIPFGKAQRPELWDYADHVDTLQFLKELP